MEPLKCSKCGEAPLHIQGGKLYCDIHVPATWMAWPVYFIGLCLWAIAWAIIFGGVSLGWFPHEILINAHDKWYFLIPAAVGATVFVVNILLWWAPGRYSDYSTEVTVIEFVERNASWFLFASGTFLGGGSFFFNFLHMEPERSPFVSAFITFISLSVFCLLPVVSLYWMPYQENPKRLVILRHLKTIPFAFGVGFFAAALLALLLSLRTLP